MSDTEPNICPGPCNRAWEAAERNTHNTGEPHNLQPVDGQPIWCADCRDTIDDNLLKLPNLVNQLADGLQTPPADAGRITRNQDHPSPSPHLDLADEACRWAVNAETTLRDRLHHPQPERSTMRKAVAYLTGNLSAMLNLDPEGIDFGINTNNWQRRLTNATGNGPARYYRIPATCPTCDQRGQLRRKEGDDLVTCRACGTTWDYDHWQLLVRAAVQAPKAR